MAPNNTATFLMPARRRQSLSISVSVVFVFCCEMLCHVLSSMCYEISSRLLAVLEF